MMFYAVYIDSSSSIFDLLWARALGGGAAFRPLSIFLEDAGLPKKVWSIFLTLS